MLTILCVFVGIGLIILFAFLIIKEAREFFFSLLSDERAIEILAKITNPIGMIFGDAEVSDALTGHIENAIEESINGLVSALVSLLSDIAASIPGVLFFVLVTVIASVYFALDVERINRFVKMILPRKICASLIRLKTSVFSIAKRYVRSYLIIMGVTFVVILIGLLLLRVENAVIISVTIAILDLLPIVGVGSVLLPWSIANFLLGNTGRGIGLIILLIVHALIREFAEPKIIGKSVGVHPIVSLILLYVGYSTLGFIGILFVPLLAVLLNIFFDKSSVTEEHPD